MKINEPILSELEILYLIHPYETVGWQSVNEPPENEGIYLGISMDRRTVFIYQYNGWWRVRDSKCEESPIYWCKIPKFLNELV